MKYKLNLDYLGFSKEVVLMFLSFFSVVVEILE